MNPPDNKHRVRMQRKKEHIDTRIAEANIDRGVIVVNTGNGKGKSSSAFGMVARALGHDMRVAVIQFIKGSFSTGEETFFRGFPAVDYHVMGEGYTWDTQDRERDTRTAMTAWHKANEFLVNPKISLIVLDELNIALKHRYIPVSDVISALRIRPPHQHVVITGRAAPQEIIDVADTVTEMQDIKHAFRAGVTAQLGIEL
ncbi:MAG: cob(I)yrinic acid a,c-diamide adenosyltransferase [Pseudomonadota bacterium]